jgi:hypothetical protein
LILDGESKDCMDENKNETKKENTNTKGENNTSLKIFGLHDN